MSNEIVSVLVPFFNRKDYIVPCLKSILGQSFKAIKIIVYDDGSTDKTVEVVKSMKIPTDKLKIIEGEHVGVAAARNILLDEVDTRYACWQDSDDISNSYRIELQMELVKELDSHCVMTLCQWLNRVNEEQRMKKPKEMGGCRPGCATALFLVEAAPRFNDGITMGGEDRAWRTRFELREDVQKFPFVPRILYYIRRHAKRIGIMKMKARYKKEVAESNQRRHEEYESIRKEFGRQGG